MHRANPSTELYILTIKDNHATLFVTAVALISQISSEISRTVALTPISHVEVDHWQRLPLGGMSWKDNGWRLREHFVWPNGSEKYLGT